ncbi:hypothetical protein PC9H_009812 [Pleurotus ostreatus]|uniref:Uncharacterized protein n=2 Tax=Pleurotus TaxID=5320 RepID=A0A8H6ZUF9_PLEOS|nr:uncharacterized protein PC9H_009812 [Pleurotus ostreatus]KAF7424505.1 hypothetical protein PC9H_009812 [Pleurotus ostreatus]KAG9224934.1 hypothetical protein CCMSSC00406_0001915 [Pleurotus cornucopiae]KAJ8692544.1 hypothetical protein PTI98_009848 [Pleurotus ostreatus]
MYRPCLTPYTPEPKQLWLTPSWLSSLCHCQSGSPYAVHKAGRAQHKNPTKASSYSAIPPQHHPSNNRFINNIHNMMAVMETIKTSSVTCSQSSPGLMLENVDAPSEQQVASTGSLPPPPRRSVMRIIPILQQPPQLEASGAPSSHYFAFGSSTVNGVTQLVVLRKKRRYYAPPIAQAESQELHAANSFVSLAMQSLRHRVNTRTRAPLNLEEVDENADDEDYYTLPVHDPSPQPRKRRRVA